jgi:hypothetical protein
MSDKQLLVIANASVYGSQDFIRASEDWERLAPNNKTWTMWKTTFLRAHRERLRLIQASGGISLGNANAAGGLCGMLPSPTTARLDSYLDNIANAATQDSVQLNLLLESNKTLIEQNRLLAGSSSQLSVPESMLPLPLPPSHLLALAKRQHSCSANASQNSRLQTTSHARVYGACYTHFSYMHQAGTKSHYYGNAGGYEGRGGVQQRMGACHSLTGRAGISS